MKILLVLVLVFVVLGVIDSVVDSVKYSNYIDTFPEGDREYFNRR